MGAVLEDYQELRIGGRKSELAVAQSEIVKEQIESLFKNIKCSILAISTLGDIKLDQALYTFGGKSVWTKELEVLLLGDVGGYKQIDIVVHSLKDLPTNLPEEFELGCITKREDPRDALVMKQNSPYTSLDQLPAGSIVGTSSIRRLAQLLKAFPNLRFESVRGNLRTRFRKLDEGDHYDCIILAAAGLHRLGLKHRITQYLDEDVMYYSVGQGSLGIEIRRGDEKIRRLLSQIEHKPSAYCCTAERSLMRHLEGGCSVPLGVKSDYTDGELSLKAVIVSPDGIQSVSAEIKEPVNNKKDCEAVGVKLGNLLIEKGGKEILDEIDFTRINIRPNGDSSSTASSIASFRPASPRMDSPRIGSPLAETANTLASPRVASK